MGFFRRGTESERSAKRLETERTRRRRSQQPILVAAASACANACFGPGPLADTLALRGALTAGGLLHDFPPLPCHEPADSFARELVSGDYLQLLRRSLAGQFLLAGALASEPPDDLFLHYAQQLMGSGLGEHRRLREAFEALCDPATRSGPGMVKTSRYVLVGTDEVEMGLDSLVMVWAALTIAGRAVPFPPGV